MRLRELPPGDEAWERAFPVLAQLLDHLESVAISSRARCVELDSGHARIGAHRFYRRRGYQDTGLTFRRELSTP